MRPDPPLLADDPSPEHAESTGPRPVPPVEPDERRLMPRATPLDHRAWLTWFEGETCVTARARLRDIGQGGISALVESPPPADREVWFRLQDGDGQSAVEGRVVGSVRVSGTTFRVRVAFWRPCPDATFRSAIERFHR